MKRFVKSILNSVGLDIIKHRPIAPDFEEFHSQIIAQVNPYTVTSPERLFALIEAVRYIVRNGVPGDLVECGVFKGGSVMAMGLTLIAEPAIDRDIYLFDTFAGMPKPGDEDVDFRDDPAMAKFDKLKISDSSSKWTNSPLEEVRQAVFSIGYPRDRLHFIKGMVEDTLPGQAPQRIALLRLDTDWYQSTKHELEHLYHRVAPGGIVIVDDYGHFQGAKKATDEFFSSFERAPYMSRIDYSGRLIVKDPDPIDNYSRIAGVGS